MGGGALSHARRRVLGRLTIAAHPRRDSAPPWRPPERGFSHLAPMEGARHDERSYHDRTRCRHCGNARCREQAHLAAQFDKLHADLLDRRPTILAEVAIVL
jgi:hypothetical protein